MTHEASIWMPTIIGDHLGETMHLTCEEQGAYFLLLIAYWREGGPLPDDDKVLAAIVRLTSKRWRKLRPVLTPLFQVNDGKWHHQRQDAELTKAIGLTRAKSEAGRRGARNRWNPRDNAKSTAMAEPSSSHTQTDAPSPSPSPSPSPAQKEVSCNFPGLDGKKVGSKEGCTIENPDDRISLFQNKLAKELGPVGWSILESATDATNPDHQRCLALCKAAAQRLRKGWPSNWPISSSPLARPQATNGELLTEQ